LGILQKSQVKTKTNKQAYSIIKKRPDILFVIGSLEIGGTEKQMYALAGSLKALGFSCSIFALQADGPLRRRFERRDIPVYGGGLKKGDLRKSPWKIVWSEWKLLRLIRKKRPAIVHAFLPLVTFMAALAGNIVRVPMVITSRRALGTHQDRYWILKPLDHIANRLSHRVIVNSKAVWKDIVERDHIDESKLFLIYNGVDSAPFKRALRNREEIRQEMGIDPNEKVIIIIANLIQYKGHSDFIRAASRIVKEFPAARFLIVGEDRGTKDDLESDILELGFSTQVKFLGQRKDIPRLMTSSDLSVLPSHEEGFSNVILESMAAGLPVVATRVGGNSEAVVNGVTGWLVPPHCPDALYTKILDLLKDPVRAKEWGMRGRERIERMFTIQKMVESHLKLYVSAQ